MIRSWGFKALGEVCDLATGGTPSRTRPDYFGGEIPWLVSGDINKGEIFDCDGRITNAGMLSCNAKLLPINSVMIALNGQGKTRATVAILRIAATCNQSLVCITPKDHSVLLPEFLYANLRGRYEELRRLTSDDDKDRRGLNMRLIREIKVPIPSIREQRLIVAILAEGLHAIAIAKATTERYLQCVEELGRSLEEGCFDEHIDHAFRPRQLTEACELIADCEHKTAPTQETGYPSIRTPNIGRGVLTLTNVNRVSQETYEAWTRRAVPAPGDLILAREAPAGNVAVIPKGLKVCLGQRTVLIRPKRDIFLPQYLAHLLLQRGSQQRLLAHSRGATVEHVNLKDIRAFQIAHVPSLEVQRKVIEKLKDIHDQQQSLVTVQQQKLAALHELQKSLLHQAFTGQLTAKSIDKQLALAA